MYMYLYVYMYIMSSHIIKCIVRQAGAVEWSCLHVQGKALIYSAPAILQDDLQQLGSRLHLILAQFIALQSFAGHLTRL